MYANMRFELYQWYSLAIGKLIKFSASTIGSVQGTIGAKTKIFPNPNFAANASQMASKMVSFKLCDLEGLK